MRRRPTGSSEAVFDMTPMIDMTFQLIAFFMVLINFSEADQDERIKLPTSALAKPPDGPMESPVTIQMAANGNVLFGGEEVDLPGLRRYLIRERDLLLLNNKTAADATVVIRADASTATGKVQELVQLCQEEQFEKFTLRAKEEVE
jgi:biopolymer transport protein ExbD